MLCWIASSSENKFDCDIAAGNSRPEPTSKLLFLPSRFGAQNAIVVSDPAPTPIITVYGGKVEPLLEPVCVSRKINLAIPVLKSFSLPAEPITNVPKVALSLSWLWKERAVPPVVPEPLKVLFVILASIGV